MIINQILENIESIVIHPDSHPSFSTAAGLFNKNIISGITELPKAGKLEIRLVLDEKNIGVFLRLDDNGSGLLKVSHTRYLYGFISYLLYELSDIDGDFLKDGHFFRPSFLWNRSSYDNFLTQEWRVKRNFNKETYIRELARQGFTHLEVNGLAYPMGIEDGPKGETYPMFYTYCPALDQFVYSSLNEGLYPKYYLSANLAYLKDNARLAREYGLTPGLTCFEPRSVPEEFFDRYPMLRGARVDHPFRSFKPRYNMTITHQKVRNHYAEMMHKLLKEVPDLGFIAIWANDSGAGFEHTKSLYVGRNGGAYLIREWKDDEEISLLAGENVLQFFHTIRNAAAAVNPDFRVITRMESFYGEHDTIWNGMGKGLEIESASLAARGWEMPYTHPKYPEINSINGGSVYQLGFDPVEKEKISELETQGSNAHFYFSPGTRIILEPLLGIPYPRLIHQRLKLFHENGVKNLALCGGTFPPENVPYNVNLEVFSRFQWNPEMNIEESLHKLAVKWVGEQDAGLLTSAWDLTSDAILAFPVITGLYTTIGFAWYRLWTRPLVPNIELIPEEERAYYEDFMCTTPHNPNNVDLSKDVLFTLTTPEKSRDDVTRIDNNLWPPLDKAIDLLKKRLIDQIEDPNSIIYDQYIRLQALHCWFMTQRNVAAWIAGVYGYMAAQTDSDREANRSLLTGMIENEIGNSHKLIELLESGVEFMALTDMGETPLIYGDNLKDLLYRRVDLMKRHQHDDPFIDHDYMMRRAGEKI